MNVRRIVHRLVLAAMATGITACAFTSTLVPDKGGQAQTSAPQHQGSRSPTSVSVTPSAVVLNQANEQQLSAVVRYADGTFDNNVSWASGDNAIVAVNPTTGMLTGVAPGVASVTATSPLDDQVMAAVTVTVRPATSQDAFVTVSPASASLVVHQTIQLSAAIQTSSGQTSSNFTWSSSDQAIALVSGTGLVTGIAPGTVSILATSQEDPTKSAAAVVTVTP